MLFHNSSILEVECGGSLLPQSMQSFNNEVVKIVQTKLYSPLNEVDVDVSYVTTSVFPAILVLDTPLKSVRFKNLVACA